MNQSKRITNEMEVRVLDDRPAQHPTAVQRTEAAIHGRWAGNHGRINQARAFLKRAKKSDARRRAEKAARKRNRR